jgi:hypothetical protein
VCACVCVSQGTDPILPLVDPSDWGVNTMQGARWETGMDNSPMYDGVDAASHNKSGPILFNTRSVSQSVSIAYTVSMREPTLPVRYALYTPHGRDMRIYLTGRAVHGWLCACVSYASTHCGTSDLISSVPQPPQ